MQWISLRSNAIKEEGGKALADCVPNCPGLLVMDIEMNDFDYKYIAQVQETIKGSIHCMEFHCLPYLTSPSTILQTSNAYNIRSKN